jgi:hypothetical protein
MLKFEKSNLVGTLSNLFTQPLQRNSLIKDSSISAQKYFSPKYLINSNGMKSLEFELIFTKLLTNFLRSFSV